MQKIFPFLWFNDQAEEAANFYTGIFPHSAIQDIAYYTEGSPAPAGTVMSVTFQLDGQEFVALNGGPHFSFTPAVSFFIKCSSQEEINHYWEKLSEGGTGERCGWLRNKFGLSWQVVPVQLGEMLQSEDRQKAAKVMTALMQMSRIDLHALESAFNS